MRINKKNVINLIFKNTSDIKFMISDKITKGKNKGVQYLRVDIDNPEFTDYGEKLFMKENIYNPYSCREKIEWVFIILMTNPLKEKLEK